MTETDAMHQLLAELDSHRLTVVLVPLRPDRRGYNEGGCRRCVADKSPRWYSQLCLRHPSSRIRNHRKSDTRIRRQNILRVLTRLANGLPSRSKYAGELRDLARRVA